MSERYQHPPQFSGRYEGCVLDGAGNCSRWNHDHPPAVAADLTAENAHPDRPVPVDQQLGCTLWKCYRNATQGMGDGSMTWWTLQPIERMWWLDTAERFREALAVHPDLLTPPEVQR